MKKLTFITLLFAASANAQPSIEVGLNSRLHGTMKAAYEYQVNGFNFELGVRGTTEVIKPVISLQAGFNSDNYCDWKSFRVSVGAFYHTGELLFKPEKTAKVKLGVSIRQVTNNGSISLEYNGQAISLGIGYLFNRNRR